jgi:hypothetical protein
MADPRPSFMARYLLETMDGTPLGKEWRGRYPDLFTKMDAFRREMGDTCNYTKACLQILWTKEVERDAAGFYDALRSSKYKG